MFTQLVPMSEGSVGGIGVVLPPLYEIFWSALILLVILLVVGLYALPRIYSMIDQRRDAIQEGLDNAEKAREDLSLASRKKEELLRDAQAEAHQIREDARAQAQQIVAQARLDAQVEAQRVQDAAQRQILAGRPRRLACVAMLVCSLANSQRSLWVSIWRILISLLAL